MQSRHHCKFHHHRSFVSCSCGGKRTDFGGDLEEDFSENTVSHSSEWIGVHGFLYWFHRPTFCGCSTFTYLCYPNVLIARPVLISTIEMIGIVYFVAVTFLIITLMSIERWLHMSRRSLVTSRRSRFTFALLFLIPIPLVLLRTLTFKKETSKHRGYCNSGIYATVLLSHFCCLF